MKVHDFEDAVDKIKPFLMDYLQERGIDTAKKFQCLHPSHDDSSPSANIVGEDTDSPRVFCFGCGRHLDIFDCAQILEKKPALGIEWVEGTLKYLAEKYDVPIETQELTEEQVYEIDTYRAYRAASELIKATNLDPVKHKRFLDHTLKRSWDLESLESLGIGTVVSYACFRDSLKQQGFTAAFLDEIDLGRKDLFNEEMMIFTWRDEHSRPVGFTGRNLKFEEEKKVADDKGVKVTSHKYNNQRTTGLKCNIFKKGNRLYGLDMALKANPPLYLFEGQPDVVTAQVHGFTNCAGIAGSSLRQDHIHLLKKFGIYDVVLCLDGDKTGQDKTKEILENILSGVRNMRVRVVVLPEGYDPDSFIREYGVDQFRALAAWTAFEWRLQQYDDAEDGPEICKQMIPFMVNEPSPVEREKLCKILATRTGISVRSITQELDLILDARAMNRSRERQSVLEKARHDLMASPADAELILQDAQATLLEIARKHDDSSFSNDDYVRELDREKEQQEDEENTDIGFELGPDLRGLRETLRGAWSQDVFMLLGGKSNAGKSALMAKLAYEIASRNQNVTVIFHTIDDSFSQLLPRFVCLAEGGRKLSINMVRQPGYWSKTEGLTDIIDKRDRGYQRVRELGHQARLIVKDCTHGSTLPFIENMVSYYQEKYPDRQIVYFLDNVHLLSDFPNKDERVRFKAISSACKNLAVRKHICFWGTVEYTKMPRGIKPNNENIGETVQLTYDANFIGHMYNELGEVPDSAKLFHKQVDWKNDLVVLPRTELIVGKNKITEQKPTLFLDFWPASSDYRHVDHDVVMRDANNNKAKTGLRDHVNDLYGV